MAEDQHEEAPAEKPTDEKEAAKDAENFTPPEGFYGNLTDEQEDKLKQIWKEYFKLLKEKEAAGVKADENADEDVGDDADGEEAFKKKAKDDAAKDEQAKEKEKKELAAMIGSHGADGFHKAFWEAARGENPDALMLRFLRARKWDVQRAFAMLAASLKWRIEQGVQEIREKGEEGMCKEEGFQHQYDVGKCYVMGTDKKDRPIVYIHVAKHHPKDQPQKSLERFTIFNMETSRSLLTPRSLGQGTLVFDLTNFGLSNMDWACVRFILECFEARYPETLGLCLVHKAPMVFNAIWTILKPVMDPVVRSKIDFTKSESDLAKHIPLEHVKTGMGGEMKWEWSYSGPAKEENKRMQDKEKKEELLKAYNDAAKEWEDLTELWIDGDKNAGKERAERHGKILMIRHLDLDPYVRGQTVYSRNGTNVGDGTVKWSYPDREEVFGQSYDPIRKELGIEGECPRNGHAGGPVAAAEQALKSAKDPDEAAAIAAGKVGSGMPKLKRRASQSLSVITPGPSDSEKARSAAEEEKERLTKELDKAKEEEKKQKEEERKRQEEEAEKRAAEEKANSGILNSISAMSLSAAHGVSNIVPSALGGDRLAAATAPPEDKAAAASQEKKQAQAEKESAKDEKEDAQDKK